MDESFKGEIMHIAIAGFHIESASFLPSLMSYDAFDQGCLRGQKIIEELTNTNTVIGGFIDICEQEKFTLLPLYYAYQGAVGGVTDETVEKYVAELISGLIAHKEQLDGVLLHLHGAAWAPGFKDVEKYFIDCVRKLLPNTPVMVAFDYHANIDSDTLAGATAAFAYHESPHTDMGDTGRRAARCMVELLVNGVQPKWVLEKPGVLTPSIFSATALKPLAEIIARARALEKQSLFYLDISILAGFSYADSHNTGFSVLVVGEQPREELAQIAKEFSDQIWVQRRAIYQPEPVYSVQEGVAHALVVAENCTRPIVLLEHADRMNDSTYVLNELLKQRVQGAAVPLLWDPQAAAQAYKAGVGNEVAVELGGHSSEQAGPRLKVRAKVLQAEPKQYRVSGSMLQGMPVNLGQTALLEVDGIHVSVVTYPFFGVDSDAFTVFGQDLHDYRFIVLRSKTHFRQYYQDVAEEIVVIDTPDHGPADLTVLPYKHLSKTTVYPFKAD